MEFCVLGPTELRANGDLVGLGSSKQRCVLGVLLVGVGRPQSIESLVDKVWGEEPPDGARGALYSYVSRLRRVFRESGVDATIQQKANGYLLNTPPEGIDLYRFDELVARARATEDLSLRVENLRSALELWRGHPFQDLSGRWVEEVRERLGRQRTRARVEWARAMIGSGRHAGAVEALEHELWDDPMSESLAAQLMTCLHLEGRQSEALACYAALRERLADELGVAPCAELQDLHLHILRTTPAERPARTGGPAPVPYRGLRTFQAEDAPWFFGRENLVDDLLSRLAEHWFVAVVGPAGSGKSSLLRAGLVPAIRSAGEWTAVLMTPTEHPLEALASVLSPPGRAFAVHRSLLNDPIGDARLAGAATVLVVDQLEEIFTRCHDTGARALFVGHLLSLAPSGMKVVVGVGADFLGSCAEYPALAALLRDHEVRVRPLTEDGVRAAILGPAGRAGLVVEPELVDVLAGEPVALPLLSHVLWETWRRRSGDRLTLEGYRQAGGVRDAVARTADRIYQDLDEDQRRTARSVFVGLTTPGAGPFDSLRRVLPEDARDRTAPSALDPLAAAGLVAVEDEAVSVPHKALLDGWPTLVGWHEEERTREVAYRESRAAAGETSRYRKVSIGAMLSTALVVVLVLASVAVLQPPGSDDNREELAAQLVTHARSQLERDPELALLLAKRAYEMFPDGATEAVLAQALSSSRVRDTLVGHHGAVTALAYTHDGQWLVSGGVDGTVRRWSADRSDDPVVLAAHSPVRRLAVSPTGAVAAASDDDLVRVWPGERTELPLELRGSRGTLALAFSADGRLLVAVDRDGAVRTWRTDQPGESALRQEPRGGTAVAAAIGDGGRLVAVAGTDGAVLVSEPGGGTVARFPSGARVAALAFSQDGKRLIVGRGDGHGEIRPVTDGAGSVPPAEFASGHRPVRAVAFSHDGRYFLAGGGDRATRVRPVARGVGDPVTLRGPNATVAVFSPDDRVVATGTGDGGIHLWDAVARPGLRVLADRPDTATNAVTDVVMSMGGEYVASGDADGVVHVRASDGSGSPSELRGLRGPVSAVALSQDGKAVAGVDGDGQVLMWARHGGEASPKSTGHDGAVSGVAFAPDGAMVTAGEDATVRMSPSGRRLRTSGPVRDVAVTATGQLAVAVDDGSVWLWSLPDARARRVLRAGHSLRTVALTPDGRFVAAAGADGTVRMWRTEDGTKAAELRGHRGAVSGLSFSADGRYLASVGVDGTARVWRWASWPRPVVFGDHEAALTSVAFGAGQTIAVGRGTGSAAVEVWTCEPCQPGGSLVVLAGQRATRDFTAEEQLRYLDSRP